MYKILARTLGLITVGEVFNEELKQKILDVCKDFGVEETPTIEYDFSTRKLHLSFMMEPTYEKLENITINFTIG